MSDCAVAPGALDGTIGHLARVHRDMWPRCLKLPATGALLPQQDERALLTRILNAETSVQGAAPQAQAHRSRVSAWTGLVATLIQSFGRLDGRQYLEGGKISGFAKGD